MSSLQRLAIVAETSVKLPPSLISELGSWAKDVNHYRSLDKGIELGFKDRTTKKDIENKLKVPAFDIEELQPNRFFIRLT